MARVEGYCSADEGCGYGVLVARGMCNMHYLRKRRQERSETGFELGADPDVAAGVVTFPLGSHFFPEAQLTLDEVRQASCAGTAPETFFPDKRLDASEQVRQAKSICAGCPIRERCLEVAIANNEEGVFGGTTERERKGMRRVRKAVELAA